MTAYIKEVAAKMREKLWQASGSNLSPQSNAGDLCEPGTPEKGSQGLTTEKKQKSNDKRRNPIFTGGGVETEVLFIRVRVSDWVRLVFSSCRLAGMGNGAGFVSAITYALRKPNLSLPRQVMAYY